MKKLWRRVVRTRGCRGLGITLRTALLAWLVTIGTLLLFIAAIVPEQKRTLLEYLRSKGNGIAVSLREIAAGAAISEDYSSVVDHCVEMIKGDAAIEYIILTRNDGFSLIHDRAGWRTGTLGPAWRAAHRVTTGQIEFTPLFGRRTYRFSQPFEYSGIDWGWIHVGLSLAGYDASVRTMYRRTGLIAVACVLLGLAGTMVYARHLVRPILRLQSVVRRVADGDLSARAVADRTDELGQLASSINTMTEALLRRDRTLQEANETLERRVYERTRQLQEQIREKERTHRALAEAQQHLIELSREAGRAEIATGVLHSVGNVLNSVNVSATLVQDQLARSQLDGLAQAVELMRTHHEHLAEFLTMDEHGRHLTEYVIEACAALALEHAGWRHELEGLAKNIAHIKEIVAMQQSYARVAGVVERLNPRELVEDAIRIEQSTMARNEVTLMTRFDPTADVLVDKHKVLLILVNLLTNAKWAVAGLPKSRRRVAVSIGQHEDRVHIAVSDQGVGIAPENLPRIFVHGFTTRPNGHGFGLHIGALAARELGGSLTAHSDGRDRGATFTLELPASPSSS
jgi:signal transduction histidine kinase